MKKNSNSFTALFMVFLMFVIISIIFQFINGNSSTSDTYFYSDLVDALHSGAVHRIEISPSAEMSNVAGARVIFNDGRSAAPVQVQIASTSDLMEQVNTARAVGHNIEVVNIPLPRTGAMLTFILPIVIVIVIVVLLFVIINQVQGGGNNQSGAGGGGRLMNFGKSRAKLTVDTDKKVTFDNVAGLNEEKNELEELVDFLKAPKKYTDIGARIPKGILLVGPPGTGKTLLARAVAGEAGAPFFSISGSDFVEMFVGVGASRVRDLFEQAKKNAPCIVFIDEIDAVGRKRGAGLGGGHDEREQTLNQLLVEMDGFGVNEGIIIIAATNRPDILDPALLRPGRFDRQVVVGRPDVAGREEILGVHARGKKMAEDVDLRVVAQTTAGFTGADLENLLNESALLSARGNKKEIDMEEIRRAFIKVGMGTEKKSRVIPEKERRITAYHESGHAILQEMLEMLDAVHMISIIPTGRAGGYMMPLPSEDKSYMSKKTMEQELIVLLGGRVAEEIILKDVTTGASNDIERVTSIARGMVTRYGMSAKIGPILLGEEQQEVFLGRDISGGRNYGEALAGHIDEEVNRIVTTAYQEATRILSENIDIMHKTAALLLEKEKITGEEFRALFPAGMLPEKNRTNPLEMEIIAPEEDLPTEEA